MTTSIKPFRMNHINVVVENFASSIAHFQKLYGAEFLIDMVKPEWHACLINIGEVIFEVFVPYEFLLTARFGPHYLELSIKLIWLRFERFLCSVSDGTLQQHLPRYSEGIRSTFFRVRDIGVAKRYFAERDVRAIPGFFPASLAIPPEENLGVIFEFAE
jgi:hypothetical protein